MAQGITLILHLILRPLERDIWNFSIFIILILWGGDKVTFVLMYNSVKPDEFLANRLVLGGVSHFRLCNCDIAKIVLITAVPVNIYGLKAPILIHPKTQCTYFI